MLALSDWLALGLTLAPPQATEGNQSGDYWQVRSHTGSPLLLLKKGFPMRFSKPSAMLALSLGSAALIGCSNNEKILGNWVSMRNGKPVEFSDKQMKDSDGIQVVDGYQVEGDKVTVYSTKGGSKVGTEYTLSEEGKKACTGPELETCIVRPDRAGKLEGAWSVDGKTLAHPADFAITPTTMISAFGNYRLENIKFEANKVIFYRHEDKAPRPAWTLIFQSDDELCSPENAERSGPDRKCYTRIKKKS